MTSVVIRKPAVAGQFYPGNEAALRETINSLVQQSKADRHTKEQAKGVVLPHAGYMYSGVVAAKTVFTSELKDTLIMLGPNHTGLGEPFSVMVEGKWQTPLGEIEIDALLAKKITDVSEYLKADTLAHLKEHSLEVLLPFLQFTKKKIKIVPIVLSSTTKTSVYQSIGRDIFQAVAALKKEKDVSVVASSDMTHYESQDSAYKKDHFAIEAIIQMDMEELLRRVKQKDISMCGVASVSVMLEVVKKLGASKATLLEYQTSGDITKDYRSVVGYAGIRIS